MFKEKIHSSSISFQILWKIPFIKEREGESEREGGSTSLKSASRS